MGASELKAIKFLESLPNTEIKISYDTQRTRLHPKSYMFHRKTGFTTAYIGSSNISKDAMTTGLEWNMKVSEKDSKNIVNKFKATFETYFNDEEKLKIELVKARGRDFKNENDNIANIDVRPYHYEQEILDTLSAERDVDIPEINPILFLRPTESLTVFLQQLGKDILFYFKLEELNVIIYKK